MKSPILRNLKNRRCWRDARREWRRGRSFGYPPCCVLRFLASCFVGRYPYVERGRRRLPRTGEWYVPCAVIHRADEPSVYRVRSES